MDDVLIFVFDFLEMVGFYEDVCLIVQSVFFIMSSVSMIDGLFKVVIKVCVEGDYFDG